MRYEVTLDDDEWLYAASEGCRRNIDAISKGRVHGHKSLEDGHHQGWFWDINGACGERCVAKWLDVPWDGCFGDLGANDVAGLFEVRTTPGNQNPMCMHNKDKDGCLYIHVTGKGPMWIIQGYLIGRKCKQQEWWHDTPGPSKKPTGRPAFWVPQEDLNHDLDLLYKRFHQRMTA